MWVNECQSGMTRNYEQPGLSISLYVADDAPAEGPTEAAASPPLFKEPTSRRPVRKARRTIPHTDCDSDEDEETPTVAVEGRTRRREHVSGSQVAELARRGRERPLPGRAAVEGSAVKGPYDETTWNTLMELGYAPTPAQGQSGTFRTPREFNPAAATPPLVHTDALAGCKRTPAGPQGASPPGPLLSAAKMLSNSRTPAFARKRSVAAELAAAAASSGDAARPAGPSHRGGASAAERGSRSTEALDGMAVLAAAAADSASEERSERQRRQQEPFTPTSSAKERALAGPDRDDALDGLVRPLLFTTPLGGLTPGPTPTSVAAAMEQQPSASADLGRATPRHSPLVLRQALHLVPPVIFPHNFKGTAPSCIQLTPQAEVRHQPVLPCARETEALQCIVCRAARLVCMTGRKLDRLMFLVFSGKVGSCFAKFA